MLSSHTFHTHKTLSFVLVGWLFWMTRTKTSAVNYNWTKKMTILSDVSIPILQPKFVTWQNSLCTAKLRSFWFPASQFNFNFGRSRHKDTRINNLSCVCGGLGHWFPGAINFVISTIEPPWATNSLKATTPLVTNFLSLSGTMTFFFFSFSIVLFTAFYYNFCCCCCFFFLVVISSFTVLSKYIFRDNKSVTIS